MWEIIKRILFPKQETGPGQLNLADLWDGFVRGLLVSLIVGAIAAVEHFDAMDWGFLEAAITGGAVWLVSVLRSWQSKFAR